MDQNILSPITPGEMLVEEFLKPMGISQNALARSMHIPLDRINHIVHGTRAITVDTALRLSIALGTTPEFWLNLQLKYDLETGKEKLSGQIIKEVIPLVDESPE